MVIKKWYIYKIINPNGQIYVGRSSNFKGRLSCYKSLSPSIVRQRLLYASLQTYGYENHKIEVLEEIVSDKDYADNKEMFWIRTQLSHVGKWPEFYGLNLSDGGTGNNGIILDAKARRNMGNARKGRKMGEKQLEGMRTYFKQNPSRSMLGKKMSEESKIKMSLAKKGKPSPRKGVPMSEKAKKNLSISKHKKALLLSRGKPIMQLKIDGTFIASFDSAKDASAILNIPYPYIYKVLRGDHSHTHSYKFIYK